MCILSPVFLCSKTEKGTGNMSLLEIKNLSHSFSENVLYKNADFSLNKGEHIGIVGQNGTGKSTLIKLCTGQLLPDDGGITWQSKISIGYLDQYAEIDMGQTKATGQNG